MKRPQISIIVAVSRNRAIGKNGKLLFRFSNDLKRFKRLTKGHAVIMGRKTFESIGRVLPDRSNIIISRNPDYHIPGAQTAHTLPEALVLADQRGKENLPSSSPPFKGGEVGGREIFIIGGGEIYKQALPYTDKLYLTIVDCEADGDTFFPDWREDFTKEVFREERTDPATGLKYTWVDLETV